MDFIAMLAELRAERERLIAAIEALMRLQSGQRKRGRPRKAR